MDGDDAVAGGGDIDERPREQRPARGVRPLLELKKGLNSEVELLKSVSLFLFHILALFVLILRSYCSWFWHMILGNEGNQVCNSGGKGHFTDSVCRYREG